MKTLLLMTALLGASAAAQPGSAPDLAAGPWDPPTRLAAQRKAMEALSFLDGEWRGEAQTEARPGKLIQTERAGPFKEGRAAVRVGGKWGYIGPDGKVVIEPKYLDAHPFSEGYAAVKTA